MTSEPTNNNQVPVDVEICLIGQIAEADGVPLEVLDRWGENCIPRREKEGADAP